MEQNLYDVLNALDDKTLQLLRVINKICNKEEKRLVIECIYGMDTAYSDLLGGLYTSIGVIMIEEDGLLVATYLDKVITTYDDRSDARKKDLMRSKVNEMRRKKRETKTKRNSASRKSTRLRKKNPKT